MQSIEQSAFRRFKRHPVRLAAEWFGVDLWETQRDILNALMAEGVRRVAVKSCHGAGKTLLAAVAALVWLYSGPDRIVITTAPTGRQVRKLLWREIRRIWHRCVSGGRPLGGEMPPEAPELKLGENWFMTGFSSNDPVNMQGFHAPGGVLVIMDEANGVHPDIWDALAGVLVGVNDRLLAIANPTEPAGPFFDLWRDPDCKKFTISAFDTPNVKAGADVIPGMISRQWVEDRRRAWGEDSVLYQSRVLGNFPTQADDRLIPLSWLDIASRRAVERDEASAIGDRENAWNKLIDLGLDVARFGPDSSIIAQAHADQGIRALHRFRKASGVDTAGWAVGMSKELEARSCRTDATGLGAVVHDLIEVELGQKAIELVPGSGAKDPTRFINARAEWLWHVRMLLDPQREGGPIAVVEDRELILQMTEIKWHQERKGRIQIESKDDFKKRMRGRSPDELDSVSYALCRQDWDVAVSVDPDMSYIANSWKV